MNKVVGRVALGIALAANGLVAAGASVPLPVIQQASGIQSLAPMLRKITPAVVGISIRSRATEGSITSRKTPGAKPADSQARAAGSGIIFDAGQGLVVTNQHVINRAEEIIVQLSDGRELAGKLVGADPDTDIAVIRVAAQNLTAIPAGNSDQVEVGDFVLAIGNPFLIGQTVSSGIVSGLNRNNVGLQQIEDFIQTDAAIYPGYSGGALVNLHGELVGINTAYVGAANVNAGMGFAIPVNMVRIVIDRVIESGDVRRGHLGITFEDATPALAREFKLAATPAAPIITKVEQGSPAELAGLRAGDVVTELGGAPVRDMSHLRIRLGLLWVDQAAELTVVRYGKPLVIRTTIAHWQQRARAQK